MAVNFWNTVTGHFKNAIMKIYKNGNWVSVPAQNKNGDSLKQVAGTYLKPNYSYQDPIFKYKWGYRCLVEAFGEDSGAVEVYTRIYNAIKYGDSIPNHYYVKYGTNELYESANTAKGTVDKKTIPIIGTEYGGTDVRGLYIYVGDTGTSKATDLLALDAVEYDFPEFGHRWCFSEPSKQYRKAQEGSSLIIPYYTHEVQIQHDEMMQNAINEIAALVKQYTGINYVEDTYEHNNKRYTAKEKSRIAKIIHDYIITHCKYGEGKTPFDGTLEAWPCFSNYTADPVCAGYAGAFVACCWRWGITAIRVHGDAGGAHAWAMVTYEPYTFLDTQIYNSYIWNEVDVTWDDPILSSGVKISNYCQWKYFNRTTSWLHSDADGTARTRKVRDGSNSARIPKYPCEAACEQWKTMVYANNGTSGTTLLYRWSQ